MKLGVFSVVLSSMKLEQALDFLAGLGVQAVEIGTGGYPGAAHCPVRDLLASRRKTDEYLRLFSSRRLTISSLSCHGNPLHPNRVLAEEYHDTFCQTVRLAKRLGVEVVTTFSGCPGGAPGDKQPNWVTCAWPPDFQAILEYQWNQVAIPYWQKLGRFMKPYGDVKVALEMHPGFLVYNPETLFRLRRAAGEFLGANFDPSHLFWQGIDVCAAVHALKGVIWHVHAKDMAANEWNWRQNGVLETKPSREPVARAWIFRTVGYGHSRQFWCQFISNLRMADYDGALSIEHEDVLMPPREGLEKGVRFLRSIIFE